MSNNDSLILQNNCWRNSDMYMKEISPQYHTRELRECIYMMHSFYFHWCEAQALRAYSITQNTKRVIRENKGMKSLSGRI